MPPRHIRSMARVAVMSVNRSPDTRTRSARCPAATRPRSARPNTRAGSAVTSALIGPRTMEQLDDLLAGIDVTLTDDILDRIDEIVPPGTDVGVPDQSAYLPPALQRQDLRRR